MKKSILRMALVVFLVIFAFLVPKVENVGAIAQSLVIWDDPIRLSDPTTMSYNPTLAVDKSGQVHVFWSQDMGTAPGHSDSIFYSRFEGDDWTQPLDVLVSNVGMDWAEFPDAAVSSDGTLHLVWNSGGQDAHVMYANGPACCAENVTMWSKPVSLNLPILDDPNIVVDSNDQLHIAYAIFDQKNIVYQNSNDGGLTFSDPLPIPNGANRPDEYAIYPRMAVDDLGRIHLVWTMQPWPGRSVMYSRSDDNGKTWLSPITIDSQDRPGYKESYGPILIDIRTIGNNQVHLIWDGAPTVERNHFYSLDGGQTWSGPNLVFPEVTGAGRSGFNEMAVDSNGTLHAVSIRGPLHSSWNGTSWSASQDIALTNYKGDAELMRFKIGLGNQLHVVWLDKNERIFTVWYVHGTSTSPGIAPQALPTFEATVGIKPNIELVLTATSQIPSATQVDLGKPEKRSSPVVPIFIGLVPALILMGFIIWKDINSKRNLP